MKELSSTFLSRKPRIKNPWGWISLLFSAFYFFSYFYTELTPRIVAIALAFYLLFIAIYIALLYCDKRHSNVLIASLSLLAFIAAPFNSSANIIFGYSSYFAGRYLKTSRALLFCAVNILLLLISAIVFDLWYAHYIFPGLVTTIAMQGFGLLAQREGRFRRTEQKLALEKESLAKVAERERIARDLHDTLGHTLSAIALKAQLAKKLSSQGESKKSEIEIAEVAKLASATLSEVRQVISGYKRLGLESELQLLVKRLKSAGFECDYRLPAVQLNAKAEASLILLITEACTNIMRHSKGTLVSIDFDFVSGHEIERTEINEKWIRCRVWDNGVNHTAGDGKLTEGNGYSGMRERVDELKGYLECRQHTDNSGFELNFYLPQQNAIVKAESEKNG